MSAHRTKQPEASHVQSSLEVLRGDVLERLLALVAVGALVGAVLLDVGAWVDAAVLFVGAEISCLWGYGWRGRHPNVAAIGFCVGCFATVTALVLLSPESGAALYYAVVVGIVCATRGPGQAALAALAACAALHATQPSGDTLLHVNYPEVAGLVLIVTAVSWLAAAPIDTALQWSWNSYARAAEQTERLRDQQGLLNRTIKSLDDANHRLKLYNQELARLRETALEARRRKAEFVVNLSHELRTPLNTILGFSRMMVKSPQAFGESLPSAYLQDAEAIYRNGQHLSSLLDDVLDLSQIEADRMGLRKELVQVAEVVAEAAATVAELYAQKGLALRVELPASLPNGYVDRTRLRQILINLLSNAARFTDQGGATIRAMSDARYLTLMVSDTGIGIRPEDQPLIWEEFRQFGSEQRRQGGRGMGLAISKAFAKLHGAKLWVESRPGEGSTFFLALPHPDEWGEPSALPSSWGTRTPQPPRSEAQLVVLLADDPEGAHLFQRYLNGYRVVVTSGERRAARYARAARARGIIVVGASQEATEARARGLMAIAAGLPVIACTMPSGTADLTAPGGVTFIPKPVAREPLAVALRGFGRSVQDIMIVDDDDESVRLLGRLVRSVSRRYHVSSASGGAEALAMLDRAVPDAMLLDLAMPGVDGHQVLAALRTRGGPQLPVIVVSGQPVGKADTRITSITIGRSDALTVGEAMRCLQQALEAIDVSGAATAGQSRRAALPA